MAEAPQPLTKWAVELFDEWHVDAIVALEVVDHGLDLFDEILGEVLYHHHDLPLSKLFNGLSDTDMILESPLQPLHVAASGRLSKSLTYNGDIGPPTIGTDQDGVGQVRATGPHHLHQGCNRDQIPVFRDRLIPLQVNPHHQGHGQPYHHLLRFDPHLVCWCSSHFLVLLDRIFVHCLALFPSPLGSASFRALIRLKGHHNRRHRTTICQQRGHQSKTIFSCLQSVKRHPFDLSKRPRSPHSWRIRYRFFQLWMPMWSVPGRSPIFGQNTFSGSIVVILWASLTLRITPELFLVQQLSALRFSVEQS